MFFLSPHETLNPEPLNLIYPSISFIYTYNAGEPPV